MKHTPLRLLVACLAVIVAAVAVAGGSAGNRTASTTFKAVPGPGAVTYGENIAYTATIKNDGKSTWTNVQFRMRAPVATFDGDEYPAASRPVAASCDPFLDAQTGEYVCTFANLVTSGTQRVTMVWTAPTIPSPTGCDGCLVASGRWLIKEAKATNGNEEFRVGPESADLLGGQGSAETLHAGGYEIAACAAGGSSLRTNQAVGPGNPVATSFCLPAFSPDGENPGLATTITEQAADAHGSETCVADLGEDCADPEGYVAKNFGFPGITFTFTVDGRALPNGYKITEVFHNSATALPFCDTPGGSTNPDGCVVSISYDPPTKIWTIVATSPTNGPWNW